MTKENKQQQLDELWTATAEENEKPDPATCMRDGYNAASPYSQSRFEFDKRPDAAFHVHCRKVVENGWASSQDVEEGAADFKIGYWYGYQAALDYLTSCVLGMKQAADERTPQYERKTAEA